MKMRRSFVLASLVLLSGCRFPLLFAKNFGELVKGPKPAPAQVTQPLRPEARLAIAWIGHATVLLQMDEKMILTDPIFTTTVGQLSGRLVAPGMNVADVPPVDAVLISHEHFDHLSQGTLQTLEPKIRRLFVPEGALEYVPRGDYPARELLYWQTWAENPADPGALTITAIPVHHVGGRYALDQAWMPRAFTGYVLRYHGLTVFYGGDTTYEQADFRAAKAAFGHFDLAILPIAPVEPRSFMQHTHVDPWESLRAFVDLGADRMMPIHYDTFINSEDEPGDALRDLDAARNAMGIATEKIVVMPIGGQRVLLAK